MARSRTAQVTLFVILGIVLLIVAGLFIFLRKDLIPSTTNPTTHDFSAVIATYESGADECLRLEGSRLFQQALLHGGYLDPAAEGLIAIPEFPTKGSALQVSEGNIVPYWVEYKGGLTCGASCPLVIRTPPLRTLDTTTGISVEKRVEGSLSAMVKPCLDRLTINEGYDLDQGSTMSVDVTISEDAVTYTLEREVVFTHVQSGATSTITSTTATSAGSLLKFYENAGSLVEQLSFSAEDQSLGDALKTIIASYSMASTGDLPPMHGKTSFDSGRPASWMLDEVKADLGVHIADNIPLISVRGSADPVFFLDPNHYSQEIYATGPFSPDLFFTHPTQVRQLSADFIYDTSWPLDLSVSPRKGVIIQPSGKPFDIAGIFQIGLYDYSFTYDLRVPILVVLEDPTLFDGKGGTLIFALETGLAGNEPMATAFDIPDEAEYISLFGDDDQRLGGDILITARDGLTLLPLADVDLAYICGDASVSAGVTGPEGTATTSLPFCLGGAITGMKDGYLSDYTSLSMVDDSSAAIEILLWPYQEYGLSIENRLGYKLFQPTGGPEWFVGNETGYLSPDDQAVLVMTRRPGIGQEEYVVAKNINVTTQDGMTAKLVKGEYDVEVYTLQHMGPGHARENFIIPADEVCVDDGWFFGAGCDEYKTIDAVIINETMLVGGLVYTKANNLTFAMTPEDYAKTTLSISYLNLNLDDITTHADLEVLGRFEEFTRTYNATLMPRFE